MGVELHESKQLEDFQGLRTDCYFNMKHELHIVLFK